MGECVRLLVRGDVDASELLSVPDRSSLEGLYSTGRRVAGAASEKRASGCMCAYRLSSDVSKRALEDSQN